ncbi:MAG: hypothetical protein ACUVSX_05995 [Aggregatilineales bacterium]
MSAVTPNQVLTLYAWFPLAALLMFMLLIARFYQRFSGERTYYRLYTVPLLLYGLAAVRYASLNLVTGDAAADLLLGIGGAVLLALSLLLGWAMLARRGRLR